MDDRSHLWETWRTCQGYCNKMTSLHGWYCWSFILRHGEQYQPTPHCNFGKITRQIPSLKLIKSDCRAAKIEMGMEIKMSYWGRKRSIRWLPSQQYRTIVEELFGLRQRVLDYYQASKAAHLHLVTMPSTQTRLPRYRLVSVRGVTCLLPKLKHRCCSISTHSWSCYLLYISLLL